MANLFELVIPVMLCSVQHEFVQGHLLPFNTRIFRAIRLGDGERILTAVCLPDELSRELPCEMLPSCDHKPEQPNAATFGWLAPLSFGFLGRCVPITSRDTVF